MHRKEISEIKIAVVSRLNETKLHLQKSCCLFNKNSNDILLNNLMFSVIKKNMIHAVFQEVIG